MAKSDLDDEKIKILVNAIEHGLPMKMAAYLVDMTPRSIYGYLEKARAWYKDGAVEGDVREKYWNLFIKLQRADATGALRQLETIDTAALTDWRAAAWRLVHGHPELFDKHGDININRTDKHEITLKWPEQKTITSGKRALGGDADHSAYELPEQIEEGEILQDDENER